MPKFNAFYAQAGGPTAVINASACGVIETARHYPNDIHKVLVGRNGIVGALIEELIDTSLESTIDIAALKHTTASVFGSCRYKLKSPTEDMRQYERLIQVFAAHDIRYFFYNGGNDSADTAHKVYEVSKSLNYPLQCISIPKTVDNDLVLTDNCPGFGSVAKYIATSILEAGRDVASMSSSSTKIFVLEVMGRHAGWIAAAAGLAAKQPDEAPHIILFPEIPFNQPFFLERVAACVKDYGYCAIVVAEGVRHLDGRFLAESGLQDAFGHTQLGGVAPLIAMLVKNHLGYKYHWAVADYLQRSARHLASATDVNQAYAVGQAAVEFAIAGKSGVMPIIIREQNHPYRWRIGEASMAELANVEKKLPREYITEDGFGITSACREYLAPLIEGEAYPPFEEGLPKYVKLNNVLLPKKLDNHFSL